MKNLYQFSFSLVFKAFIILSILGKGVQLKGETGTRLPSTHPPIHPRGVVALKEQIVESNNHVVIPFQLRKGLIVITLNIEGRLGAFVLDTGAPDFVLNSRYFDGEINSKLSATGINQTINEVKQRKVKSIMSRKRDLKWRDSKIVLLDLLHLEQTCNLQIWGLIGVRAFREHELMIDYAKKELTLFKLDKKGNRLDQNEYDSPTDTSRFKILKHLIVLKMKIEELSLKLALDTGAQSNVLDKKWLRKLTDHFKKEEDVNMIGAASYSRKAARGELHRLKTGRLQFMPAKTLITDLTSFKRSYRVYIDGLLGYSVLKQQKFSINFKKKEVYWWRSMGVPIREI